MEDKILQMILTNQTGDAEELRRDVLENAFRYTECRFRWELYTTDERADNDRHRTCTHDVFMDSVNIYVRYLNRVNGTQLEGLGADRKKNGDLACKIVYEIAIRNR